MKLVILICLTTLATSVNTAIVGRKLETGRFTIPSGVTSINILTVGGGAGGCASNGGGGGSGYVDYGEYGVNPGDVYDVQVGQAGRGGAAGADGCNGATNGGESHFGDLVVGSGGTVLNWGAGGNGGSGGGAGTQGTPGRISGDGGAGGSNGYSGTSNNYGGQGQGQTFLDPFGKFDLAKLAPGSGALGKLSVEPFRFGGGGAGGVVLNSEAPSSGAGGCCASYPFECGPTRATGYGAGGSAACYDHRTSGVEGAGGDGASGLVYVEYNLS